jgi:hypothetical protein
MLGLVVSILHPKEKCPDGPRDGERENESPDEISSLEHQADSERQIQNNSPSWRYLAITLWPLKKLVPRFAVGPVFLVSQRSLVGAKDYLVIVLLLGHAGILAEEAGVVLWKGEFRKVGIGGRAEPATVSV